MRRHRKYAFKSKIFEFGLNRWKIMLNKKKLRSSQKTQIKKKNYTLRSIWGTNSAEMIVVDLYNSKLYARNYKNILDSNAFAFFG